ncbi:MAG TPA: hypothetical protein VGU71_06590 [Candidatus Dormibacteraeota bacterium]|nr:hypothetical protein [Candidatus Dormibacteraeota bacterium]
MATLPGIVKASYAMPVSIRAEPSSVADQVRESPYRWIVPRYGSMRPS